MRTIVVCDGDAPSKHVYVTQSNYVEIEVERFGQTDMSYRFLFHYQGAFAQRCFNGDVQQEPPT